jgi:hypothetical protein
MTGTKVDIRWLMEWIAKHPAKYYSDLPLLKSYPTKDEALEALRKLLEQGKEWLE